jgi:hypothetical protein
MTLGTWWEASRSVTAAIKENLAPMLMYLLLH